MDVGMGVNSVIFFWEGLFLLRSRVVERRRSPTINEAINIVGVFTFIFNILAGWILGGVVEFVSIE